MNWAKQRKQWYHNFMFDIETILLTALVLGMLCILQILAWDIADKTVVVFEGTCEISAEKDEEGRRPMMCGETQKFLDTIQENHYLTSLVEDTPIPTITCKHTVTTYTKKEEWSCDTDNHKSESNTEETSGDA